MADQCHTNSQQVISELMTDDLLVDLRCTNMNGLAHETTGWRLNLSFVCDLKCNTSVFSFVVEFMKFEIWVATGRK